ncbi:MAG: alcohol dehydrogenase catalytic domain-containing protein [Anaerolineales bacterium]|nr:alcohol dehydrogenase catalytic domain-containing protein [Anaerolineales bacterium]MDW8161961.1 alcohol dehydrogenase catalytic domain-containing protein [Anaerolineales bacterium]
MQTHTVIIPEPRKVEIRKVELPPLEPRQVLVKVKSCALCTWEQRFYLGASPQSYPFRGGHEVSGEVVEIGREAVPTAQVGDRVALAIMTRCGACESCRRGMDNFCEMDSHGNEPGQPWGPGGLSEYVILEDYQVYKAHSQADLNHLALSEPVACVIRSVSLPPLEGGDAVLVQGAGLMGLIHVLLLKRRGMKVMVTEPDERRRQRAAELGADLAIDPNDLAFGERIASFCEKGKFRAVFFTAGGIPAIRQALSLLDKGAWLCLYGSVHPKGTLEIDPNEIHYNEWVLTGTYSHTKKSFRQAVAMISEGLIDLSPFISERVEFPKVDYAFERAISPDTYRVVVTFP